MNIVYKKAKKNQLQNNTVINYFTTQLIDKSSRQPNIKILNFFLAICHSYPYFTFNFLVHILQLKQYMKSL